MAVAPKASEGGAGWRLTAHGLLPHQPVLVSSERCGRSNRNTSLPSSRQANPCRQMAPASTAEVGRMGCAMGTGWPSRCGRKAGAYAPGCSQMCLGQSHCGPLAFPSVAYTSTWEAGGRTCGTERASAAGQTVPTMMGSGRQGQEREPFQAAKPLLCGCLASRATAVRLLGQQRHCCAAAWPAEVLLLRCC